LLALFKAGFVPLKWHTFRNLAVFPWKLWSPEAGGRFSS